MDKLTSTFHLKMLKAGAWVHEFEVKKYLGKSRNTVVYEVTRKGDVNRNRRLALKRRFLSHSDELPRVLRERRVLERFSNVEKRCLLLPTLFAAFWMGTSAAIVMTKGSGMDLKELLLTRGPFTSNDSRFYSAEILCGLEYLHSLQIVHMDIKPENILFMNSGHIMITDFDHSFDLSSGPRRHPDGWAGTVLYMSPEAAKRQVVDEKSDIWCWAAVLAELVDGCIRDFKLPSKDLWQLAKNGEVKMKNFNRYPIILQQLLTSCFQIDRRLRPSISEIKSHSFFRRLNWDAMAACRLEPPIKFDPSVFNQSKKSMHIEATNSQILQNLYEEDMLDLDQEIQNLDGTRAYGKMKQNRASFKNKALEEIFADFDYEHPSAFSVKADF